jgi:hypothetical protein
MLKILKWSAIVATILLAAAQFVRPAKAKLEQLIRSARVATRSSKQVSYHSSKLIPNSFSR